MDGKRLSERDLLRELNRLVRGEVSTAELRRLAGRMGFASFAELCEERLPEDLAKLRIGTRDVVARIDSHRRRRIDLRELCSWADELYNISFNHRITFERRGEDLITAALSALSLVCNEGMFPAGAKTTRGLDYIRSCLLRRRKFRFRNIFTHLFEDLPGVHLANKHEPGHEEGADGDPDAGEDAEPEALAEIGLGGGDEDEESDGDDGGSRWADVVILDAPFVRGKDIYTDYNWMVAFTVTTAELHEEERASEEEAEEDGSGKSGGDEPAGASPEREGDARVRPDDDERDRVLELKKLVTNFDFKRYRPRYLLDEDGIAEIILEAPLVGPAEIRYATKLFCLANRVRECHLDGKRVPTLVFPGR